MAWPGQVMFEHLSGMLDSQWNFLSSYGRSGAAQARQQLRLLRLWLGA